MSRSRALALAAVAAVYAAAFAAPIAGAAEPISALTHLDAQSIEVDRSRIQSSAAVDIVLINVFSEPIEKPRFAFTAKPDSGPVEFPAAEPGTLPPGRYVTLTFVQQRVPVFDTYTLVCTYSLGGKDYRTEWTGKDTVAAPKLVTGYVAHGTTAAPGEMSVRDLVVKPGSDTSPIEITATLVGDGGANSSVVIPVTLPGRGCKGLWLVADMKQKTISEFKWTLTPFESTSLGIDANAAAAAKAEKPQRAKMIFNSSDASSDKALKVVGPTLWILADNRHLTCARVTALEPGPVTGTTVSVDYSDESGQQSGNVALLMTGSLTAGGTISLSHVFEGGGPAPIGHSVRFSYSEAGGERLGASVWSVWTTSEKAVKETPLPASAEYRASLEGMHWVKGDWNKEVTKYSGDYCFLAVRVVDTSGKAIEFEGDLDITVYVAGKREAAFSRKVSKSAWRTPWDKLTWKNTKTTTVASDAGTILFCVFRNPDPRPMDLAFDIELEAKEGRTKLGTWSWPLIGKPYRELPR
jgi:hypothetical protein